VGNVVLLAALVVVTTLAGWDIQNGWEFIVNMF
jgi:hypothetical protein